jgi:hypothetical protein
MAKRRKVVVLVVWKTGDGRCETTPRLDIVVTGYAEEDGLRNNSNNNSVQRLTDTKRSRLGSFHVTVMSKLAIQLLLLLLM